MFKLVKNWFKKKPDVYDEIRKINSQTHFEDFNDELVDDIYTTLSTMFQVHVIPKEKHSFIFVINNLTFHLGTDGLKEVDKV